MQTPEEYEVTLRVNALVKGLKQRRGYTKKDISQHLGIGLTTFNDYLNGVSSFKLGTLIRFAQLCKLSVADILDDTVEAQKLYADMVKDKANQSKNALDFLGFMLMVPLFASTQDTMTLFCILALALTWLAQDDFASRYLALCVFSLFLIDKVTIYPVELYVFPNYNGFIDGVFAFGLQSITSLGLIFFLRNRLSISLKITKQLSAKVINKSYIEGPLLGVVLTILFVNIAAFLENIVRNLERLGVDEVFAKQFWHVTYIYDYFESIKIVLIAIVFILIFAGIRIQQHTNQNSVLV